jgi:hypothetical protein
MSVARIVGVAVFMALASARIPVAQAQSAVYAANADTTVDATLVREIDRARSRGLPPEPLLAKVREGRLKRAAVPRIRHAVIALAERLDSARAALGSGASADELIAGADAIAVGADATAVRAVRAASLGRSVSVPLGALAQLVASGVPTTKAVALIVDLMRRNATPGQVIAFGNSVESDAAGGLPAEEAARFRWRELGAGSAQTAATADAAPAAPASVTYGPGSTSSPPSKTPRRRP